MHNLLVGTIFSGLIRPIARAIVILVAALVLSTADMTKHDPLDFLLDLDGEVIVQDRGYWVKIEARRRDPSPQVDRKSVV